MSRQLRALLLGTVLIVVGGCANLDKQATEQNRQQVTAEKERMRPKGGLEVIGDRPYVATEPVDYAPEAAPGDTRVEAKGVPMAELVAPLAERAGYSTQMLRGVDGRTRVTIELRDVDPLRAVRQIAFAAGYVAIVDSRERIVRIAEEGTMTFRVPQQAMIPVGARAGMNLLSAPGQSMSTGTGATASVKAMTGADVSYLATGAATSPLEAYLTNLLGAGAKISVLADAGTVTVRGKGFQLKRAQDFLERYVAEATRRVMVELVLAEVSLSKGLEFGIDWSRVVPVDAHGATAAINIANAAGVTNPAMTVTTTTRNIASVLKALESRTQVRVLSSPSLLLANNTPGQWSKFTSRPYVPSVTTTPVSTSATTTTVSSTAAIAEVPEGTILTALANIVDSNKVWITMLAQSTDVVGQQTFAPQKDVQLTALIQSRTQMPLSVMAEHGRTMIVGGVRTSRDTKNGKGVPFAGEIPLIRELLSNVNDLASSSEVVMLLQVAVQPPSRVEVVIGESI